MNFDIIDSRPTRRDTAVIALRRDHQSPRWPFATSYLRDDGHELWTTQHESFDQAVDHYRERCRQHRCR